MSLPVRVLDRAFAALEFATAGLAAYGIGVSLPVLGDAHYDREAAWHLLAMGFALAGLAAVLLHRAAVRLRPRA